MFNKAVRILCLLLLFVAILYAADDEKENGDNNVDDTDKIKVEFILSKIKDDKTVYTPVLRDIVNSDPEKYLKILHEVKGKFSLQANRLTLEFIRGIEEYNDGKDFIETTGRIFNHDFKMTQLAIVENKNTSEMGWLMIPDSKIKGKIFLMSKNLEIQEFDKRYYAMNILDWLTIFEDLEGKYRSTLKFDSYYVASELALWAWVGLCKEDYIAAGLAWDSCKKVLSRTTDDQNQTKPNTEEVLKQRKEKIQEILADYKLKQIKKSPKFDNAFENILKSLQALNAAFSIKSDTKTEIESLTQQFEKSQKFLDDTSSETEQSKPLNKLIRLIINCNVNCPSPKSHFYIDLGGSDSNASVRNNSFPVNFVLAEAEISREIWDLLGDFLPQDHAKLFELLNCDHISRGFFKVNDYLTIFFSYLNREMGYWINSETLTREQLDTFFKEMPAKRQEFYMKLHQTFFFLRSFALYELAQTNYDDLKKILLDQQNLKNVTELFKNQLTRTTADTDDDILRQFAVFMSYTNKENFDEGFFKKLFESKFNNNVLYVLAEMLWDKFQSSISFNRLSLDLQNMKKSDNIDLNAVKGRINLLNVMSYTSDALTEKFRKLMQNLMTSENGTVQFALFQIFEKYGVPDSFVEKVKIASNDKTIFFHKPDSKNFPMMVSNLAMSIIASKNELPESYRTNASYFDRQIMFEYLMKILGNQNEYDELVKKYKIEDEEVPEDLEPLKQLILNYLYTMDAEKKKKLFDEIISSSGAWDALRASGSNKSDLEIEKLRKLADEISRRVKVIKHLTNDKADDKFTAELNTLKGKSLSYLEYTKLAYDWSIKYDFEEVAVYTERLADGKGLRLMVYTVKSKTDIETGFGYGDIVAAKYTRYGVSQMVVSTDYRYIKGENLLENDIKWISDNSTKYTMSQFEFYYHIQH